MLGFPNLTVITTRYALLSALGIPPTGGAAVRTLRGVQRLSWGCYGGTGGFARALLDLFFIQFP